MTTASPRSGNSSSGRGEASRRSSRPRGWRSRARPIAVLTALVTLVGCQVSQAPIASPAIGPTAPGVAATAAPSSTSPRPDWFDLILIDVRTGRSFTVGDFAGKVVLIETMAEWCPTCREQQAEVQKLRALLGYRADLVSISLDVDMEEDSASLKEYAEILGYDWYIAVAPILMARALGNEYSAEYLNPPASPMLLIDRNGGVYGLPYGLKTADSLRTVVAPLLGN